MSFESGQASDHIDLANQLRLFLTGGSGIVNVQYTGTGNGELTAYSLGASAVDETWTLTCTAAALDGGTFSVVGSVTGALADATVGVAYSTAQVNFTITDGTTDWAVGDTITFRSYFSGISSPWTQLGWTPGDVVNGGMELSVRGPGAAVDKRVFINLRSQHDAASSAYTWDIRGATDYLAGSAFGGHPGESIDDVHLILWNQAINWWFYANDRRFIVVAKVNTVYTSAYAGFLLPWATPEQYPFPLYIGASRAVLDNYTSTLSGFRHMADPGYGSATVRSWDGTWKTVANHHNTNSTDYPTCGDASAHNDAFVWPYLAARYGDGNGTTSKYTTVWNYAGAATSDGGVIDSLVPTSQGERMMLPCTVLGGQAPIGIGALDGVYFPAGSGLSPEQTATYSGRTFRAFPNVSRLSPNDWFMVEEN